MSGMKLQLQDLAPVKMGNFEGKSYQVGKAPNWKLQECFLLNVSPCQRSGRPAETGQSALILKMINFTERMGNSLSILCSASFPGATSIVISTGLSNALWFSQDEARPGVSLFLRNSHIACPSAAARAKAPELSQGGFSFWTETSHPSHLASCNSRAEMTGSWAQAIQFPLPLVSEASLIWGQCPLQWPPAARANSTHMWVGPLNSSSVPLSLFYENHSAQMCFTFFFFFVKTLVSQK